MTTLEDREDTENSGDDMAEIVPDRPVRYNGGMSDAIVVTESGRVPPWR